MAAAKDRGSSSVRVAAGSSWTLTVRTAAGKRGVRAGAQGSDSFDALVRQIEETGRVKVHSDLEASAPARRGAAAEALALEVPLAPGERYAALVRHPSGALTVHGPATPIAGRRAATIRIQARGAEPTEAARRGIGSFLRVVLFKVAGKLGAVLLEKLVTHWETRHWEGQPRGWVKVTPQSLLAARAGTAKLAKAAASDFKPRNLLLLHGTLSSTDGCFAKLVGTEGPDGRDFFDWAKSTYGDAIFGFNHPTLGATLEENAEEMLAGLPDRGARFDVVTHSRGGLLLRQLVERREAYPEAQRFTLGRAVLVAVPNEGTMLASEARWEHTIGWVANLLDLFPDNPFTFGVSFVAEGLSWLAQSAVGRLRGLAAMDPDDREIALLQSPPGPPPAAYAALVANYEPEELATRLFDAGMDGFFSGANDLVVPSEGGWRTDRELTSIPGDRIGCYGPGGNMPSGTAVHHLNLFQQPATVEFLIRALVGQTPASTPLDPKVSLPFQGRFRSIAAPRGARLRAEAPLPTAPQAAKIAPSTSVRLAVRPRTGDALQLFVLGQDPWNEDATPLLIASYRNARVITTFPVKGGEAGQHYREIIEQQRAIRRFAEGAGDEPAWREPQLIDLGASLFRQLFPNPVRRLYDEVRSKNAGRRLDLILTSSISWLNDLPWEFAYDSDRANYLALEEINFTRNVMTTIPAEEIVPGASPLRLLVVSSEPSDVPQLSTAREVGLIGAAFRNLAGSGLLEVEELAHATPALLQQRLYESALGGRPFDALHFIGHGQYDIAKREGFLLMEDEHGASFPVDADSLRQILCRRGLRLVFLNACESAVGSPSNFNRGVAPRLVQGGIPTVVANQYAVLDRAAVIFAHQFYLALACGAPVGDAAREARVAVNYALPGGTMDWAVPVVFAQNPREALVDPDGCDRAKAGPPPVLPPLAAASPPIQTPPTTRAARRPAAKRKRRTKGARP